MVSRIITLTVLFFTLTPVTIAVALFSLATVSKPKKPAVVLAANTANIPAVGVQVYAALPIEMAAISAEVHSGDARVEIVRQYLHRYKSPLESHAPKLVAEADKNSLDFRLLTAIAQQESNL